MQDLINDLTDYLFSSHLLEIAMIFCYTPCVHLTIRNNEEVLSTREKKLNESSPHKLTTLSECVIETWKVFPLFNFTSFTFVVYI